MALEFLKDPETGQIGVGDYDPKTGAITSGRAATHEELLLYVAGKKPPQPATPQQLRGPRGFIESLAATPPGMEASPIAGALQQGQITGEEATEASLQGLKTTAQTVPAALGSYGAGMLVPKALQTLLPFLARSPRVLNTIRGVSQIGGGMAGTEVGERTGLLPAETLTGMKPSVEQGVVDVGVRTGSALLKIPSAVTGIWYRRSPLSRVGQHARFAQSQEAYMPEAAAHNLRLTDEMAQIRNDMRAAGAIQRDVEDAAFDMTTSAQKQLKGQIDPATGQFEPGTIQMRQVYEDALTESQNQTRRSLQQVRDVEQHMLQQGADFAPILGAKHASLFRMKTGMLPYTDAAIDVFYKEARQSARGIEFPAQVVNDGKAVVREGERLLAKDPGFQRPGLARLGSEPPPGTVLDQYGNPTAESLAAQTAFEENIGMRTYDELRALQKRINQQLGPLQRADLLPADRERLRALSMLYSQTWEVMDQVASVSGKLKVANSAYRYTKSIEEIEGLLQKATTMSPDGATATFSPGKILNTYKNDPFLRQRLKRIDGNDALLNFLHEGSDILTRPKRQLAQYKRGRARLEAEPPPPPSIGQEVEVAEQALGAATADVRGEVRDVQRAAKDIRQTGGEQIQQLRAEILPGKLPPPDRLYQEPSGIIHILPNAITRMLMTESGTKTVLHIMRRNHGVFTLDDAALIAYAARQMGNPPPPEQRRTTGPR